MNIQLSPRLQRIADYVTPGSRVLDVGTDHAYIPIWLLQTGRCVDAIASDIRPGPLHNAEKDAEKYGVASRLELRLCDGLSGCCPEDADTVIIAGMGGETIVGILEAAPWVWDKHLILQPQTKQPELRDWLRARGLAISDAALSYDAGRIYLIWSVHRGSMADYGFYDPPLLTRREPLLKPYTEDRIKRLRKQIQGVSASSRSDPALLEALRQELEESLTIHEEVLSWQA